jgi:hypothetical protein
LQQVGGVSDATRDNDLAWIKLLAQRDECTIPDPFTGVIEVISETSQTTPNLAPRHVELTVNLLSGHLPIPSAFV